MRSDSLEYFNGPFLKKNIILYRHYQYNIVNCCNNKNSLVILPTGLGKTIIGILLIAHSLNKYSKAKILMLAPTRPLVAQHRASCQKFLNIQEERIVTFTGKITPDKRILLFNNSRIIISTPQVIKNDLIRGRYDLTQVSLIIFDEAHKTKGNYAYNFISKEYINTCNNPLILGLTASPGKDYEHIQEICDNLFIENIIFKDYEDKDVKDYIYDIDIYINLVNLPLDLLELSQIWNNLFKNFLKFFIDRKIINPFKKYYSKLDFLRISHDLTLSLKYEKYMESEVFDDEILDNLFYQNPKIIDIVRDNKLDIHSIFSYCSSCISILHGKDLLETQDISLFKSFLERLKFRAKQDILSAKRIVNSEHFKFIFSRIEQNDLSKFFHPKISQIISILKEEFEEFHNNKIIIFTQYREMAENLKNRLQDRFDKKITIEKFIGQTSKIEDNGFPQKLQIEILEKFRNDEINILIATSVAEEGLDIPNVDAIIFYESVPSEIRLIQRRGRTGRNAPGRCYILLTEGTIDIPFYIVARRKEKQMNSVLIDKKQLKLTKKLKREKISFIPTKKEYSGIELIQSLKERKEREKISLANRSVEDIILQLDEFCTSDKYKALKDCGITLFSDLIKMDDNILRSKILKIKRKIPKPQKKQKIYLNKNVKCLINLAKTYSKYGKINFKKFEELARKENIVDQKFNIHFNQACYLGYLKKENNLVHFVEDYH
ncbi:MAG: DEAD/DEAH box helicase [Promethearchaeota archaeon]